MPVPKLLAGASGYSFKEWKGSFYPDRIKPEAMLAFYAERLPTVEINHSFYQMPKTEVLAHWAAVTPPDFRFAIKASRRITHIGRLKADQVADSVAYLYGKLATLGAQRGPVLFQLPPNLKNDLPRLQDFLALLPADHRAAFEFRHDSWFDDDVFAALSSAGAALCLSEREDGTPPPLETYAEPDLAAWAERLSAKRWREAYAYFMHEPTAPVYAAAMLRLCASAPAP